jgi:23S rRNA (guanosine2251-2'-O)-methyltransferase
MSNFVFEIRVCESCGLRYPLAEGHSFGARCPQCLGNTRVVLKKTIREEGMMRVREKSDRYGDCAVLLDNIRSAWNVGSIFRSADGFGFDHIYLCGITPTPENEAVRKTSLGAEEYVAWSYHKDAVRLVQGLKVEGWKVCALEEHEAAKDIHEANPKARDGKRLLIVGSEVTGVDPDLLALCDEIYFIPMSGEKRSFNAAIAFSIAAFAFRNP